MRRGWRARAGRTRRSSSRLLGSTTVSWCPRTLPHAARHLAWQQLVGSNASANWTIPSSNHAALSTPIVAHIFPPTSRRRHSRRNRPRCRSSRGGRRHWNPRCLMTGGDLLQALYHESEPYSRHREADDRRQSIDHVSSPNLLSLQVP